MKKILSFGMVTLLILLMCVTFSSCEEETTIYTVGICGEDLDDGDGTVYGFKDMLRSELGDEAVEFIEKDSDDSRSAVKEFEEKGVDLIFVNDADALKVIAKGTEKIPVIGAEIEDYASLFKIEDYSGVIGGNVTGINSIPSYKDQLDFIKEVVPDVKTVALIYCSRDKGAEYRAEQLMEQMEIESIGCDAFVFKNADDAASAATTAANAADVLYIVSGEKTLSLEDEIREAIGNIKTPVLSDSEDLCEECSGASIYVTDIAIGEAAAKSASRILTEIADITKIQTGYATDYIKVYNETLCEEQGIDTELLENADFVKVDSEEE